jgi:membrane protease YdiL (CAAX protease family)
LFPSSSSWARIMWGGGLYSIVAIASYYIPTAALIVQYHGRLSPSKIAAYALLGLLIGALVTIPTTGVRSLWVYLLTAITFSLFGGFGEELFFRGLLYDYLEESVRRRWAVLIQAALFGLNHPWNPMAALAAFIFGLFLGALRPYLGVEACIGLHYGINVFTNA